MKINKKNIVKDLIFLIMLSILLMMLFRLIIIDEPLKTIISALTGTISQIPFLYTHKYSIFK